MFRVGIRHGVFLLLVALWWGCVGDPSSPEAPRPPDPAPVVEETEPALSEEPAAPVFREQDAVAAVLAGETPADAQPDWLEAVRFVQERAGEFEFDGGQVSGIDLATARVSVRGPDLTHLQAFSQLRRLRIASSDLTDEDLAILTRLTGLRELVLRYAPIGAEGLRQLGALAELVSLDLQRSPGLDEEALAVLGTFSQLTGLGLVDGVFPGEALEQLVRLEKLRRLDLRGCSQVTAEHLAVLQALPQLQVLRLGGSAIDDDVLAGLAKITTLRSLTLEDASITDTGLEGLAGLPLEDLNLARCFRISDGAFAVIGRFGRLRTLYLRDILISGSGIAQLAPLEQLSSLRLRQTGVQDPALVQLAELTSLRRLELSAGLVSDAGLAAIGRLVPLEQLELADSRLSDTGVAYLAELQHLAHLNLAENEGITDASIDTLDGLGSLRYLDLRGSSLSEQGWQELRRQLPSCEIVR